MQAGDGAKRIDDADPHTADGADQNGRIQHITDVAILLVQKTERAVVGRQFVEIDADKRDERDNRDDKMAECGDGEKNGTFCFKIYV